MRYGEKVRMLSLPVTVGPPQEPVISRHASIRVMYLSSLVMTKKEITVFRCGKIPLDHHSG
ncbi:hypothetical protein HAX54_032801, partial [Datura stramonium]|nr:hypothetical protein [Datura stramonium]